MASAEEQAELEKARSAIPVPVHEQVDRSGAAACQPLACTAALCSSQEPPKGSDLERMLATGGSVGVLDHAAPLPR